MFGGLGGIAKKKEKERPEAAGKEAIGKRGFGGGRTSKKMGRHKERGQPREVS